jgi:hypothetical protein
MSGIWAQPLAVQLALASLMFVLVCIIIRAIRWFGNIQEATLRMRQVRLGVSNQAIIDADRRLIVVRRDDVEHVLLIGGGHNAIRPEASEGYRATSVSRTRRRVAMENRPHLPQLGVRTVELG